MDWNNINTDRDTSGLGPIEYDQSKVPSLIRKHADDVRGKSYGQQIREAQARNAEYAGLIASEAKGISTDTQFRQDTVETQFNSIQQELTDKDPISAPEIIAARNGEATLANRLDTADAQLAETMKKTDEFVLVEFFHQEGETDDTLKLRRAIQHCKDNGVRRLQLTKDIVLDETVIVDAPFLTIYGDTKTDRAVAISVTTTFTGTDVIEVTAQGVNFNKIRVSGDGDTTMTTGTLTGINYNLPISDTDSYLTECNLRFLKNGVVAKGRNVKMFSNIFALVNFPVILNAFVNTDNTVEDLRGFEIKRNIFHTCGQPTENLDFACLLTVNDCTQNQDIDFSDNLIEQGVNRLFKGYYHGLRFNNNKTTTTAFPSPIAVELLATPTWINTNKFSEIIGNTINGGSNSTGETFNFISSTGKLRLVIIEDNNFNITTKEAIIINGDLEESSISNNKFRSQSYKYSGEYHALDIQGDVLESRVEDNAFYEIYYKNAIHVGGTIFESSVNYNLYDPSHPRLKVLVTGNPSSRFNKRFDNVNEIYESVDSRNTFAGSTISSKEYKRLNPENENAIETLASEKVEVDGFTDVTKQNGRRIFNVRSEGVLEEKGRFNKDGFRVSGYLMIGAYYLWVDAAGKLRIKASKPISDTDGVVVGVQT